MRIKYQTFFSACFFLAVLLLLHSCSSSSDSTNSGATDLSLIVKDILGEKKPETNPSSGIGNLQEETETKSPVRFSHKAGFYQLPIELSIEASEGEIHYTNDGSMPGKNSPIYSKPLNINQSVTIRVRLLNDEKWVEGNYSNTYFVGLQSSFPVVSLSTDSGSLWSPDSGIYSGLTAADSFVMANPSLSNFFYDFERPVHVEYFERNGMQVINQDAGLRIFGGMTRMFPEKSMRIVARRKYGNNFFRYRFFPDKDIDKFKSLVLRTSGNDYRSTRFRDAFTTSMASSLDIDIQASRSILLFVNGKFWGIYDLREKIDEDYLEANHGADPLQTDLLQGRQTEEHGNADAYNRMLDFMSKNDISKNENYAKVKEMMDVRNYTNYILTQIYLNNLDARGNVRFWRAGNLDGRFRWILYDTDFGFGASKDASGNYLHDCLNPSQTSWYNPGWSTFLLRSLVKNQDFRDQFIQQSSYLISTIYNPDSVIRKINLKVAELEPEMDRHLKKNKQTKEYWYKEIEKMKDFARERPAYFRQHLERELNPGDTFSLSADVFPANSGMIRVNGNLVDAGYEGVFYSNVPLQVEAVPNALYKFSHWDGEPANSCATIKVRGNKTHLKAVMKKRQWSAAKDDIVFSEASPAGTRTTGRDWVEINNRGKEEIDISHWVFADQNSRFEIPGGTILKPEEFLVVCRDTAAFRDVYSDTSIQITGNLPSGFSRKTEQYFLLDDNGAVVDHLIFNRGQFGEQIPETFTLVLAGNTESNDFSDRWAVANGLGTPGKDNNSKNTDNTHNFTEFNFFDWLLLVVLLVWG